MIDHALRRVIDAETHARPSIAVAAPAVVFHAALMGVASPEREIESFIDRLSVKPVHRTDRHAILQTPAGLLKWERHSEFITWTLFAEGAHQGAAPPDWWASLSGACAARA